MQYSEFDIYLCLHYHVQEPIAFTVIFPFIVFVCGLDLPCRDPLTVGIPH